MIVKPTYAELEEKIQRLEQAEIENKKIQKALRQSQEKYRQLFELESDAIFLIDNTDGTILEANRAAIKMYGYTRKELLKMRNVDLSAEPGATQKATREGHPVVPVRYHKKKDGSFFPVEITGSHFDWHGQRVHIAAIRDIGWRMEAEQALRQSEKQFSLFMDYLPACVYIKDADGKTLFVNRYFKKAFGEKEWIGKTVWDLFPKEIAQTMSLDDNDALANNYKINLETISHSDNRAHVYQTQKFAIIRPGKKPFLGGISLDITELKQAEEQLRRLRNYLSNIIDSMPSILIGLDADARVSLWNKTAEKSTGISAQQARGRTLFEVFPRMAIEIEKNISSRKIKEQKSFLVKSRDRYEDITIYPLVEEGFQGQVIRVDDVTQKVKMEEMMIQNEKMLSVGGLAAGMAHEINNPLAGMMQTASVMANRLIQDKNIPANLQAAQKAGTTMEAIQDFMENRSIPRMLEAINESGQRVAAIVNNMLSFARKSDNTSSLHSVPELFDKTLELAATNYILEKKYDFKSIEIKKEYQNNLPPLPCEGAKIQQVLLNILLNGSQAMQEAKTPNPMFIIRARAEQKNICIEIEDNGPGMDKEICKRIFEPFYTTKPVGVGTGLGLSVSYFIITKNHGGTLRAESSPGKGANFIICLPLEGVKTSAGD